MQRTVAPTTHACRRATQYWHCVEEARRVLQECCRHVDAKACFRSSERGWLSKVLLALDKTRSSFISH